MSRALRMAATLGALGLVLWLVAPQDVMAALKALHPGLLAVATAFLVLQIWLSALRWKVTAQALGLDLPARWSVQEYGLSVAANTFLPGGVLGDLARILRTRHFGWGNATASVLIERLAGQIALGVVAVGAVAVWLGALHAVFAIGVAGIVLAVLGRSFPKGARLLWQAWTPRAIWPRQATLSMLILICNLLGFWAAALSVGVALGPEAALVVIPLTLLSMLVPLTINGWGIREGVAAALWPLYGVATAQAVAASLAFGLACMAAALLGLLPWLLRRSGHASSVPSPLASEKAPPPP